MMILDSLINFLPQVELFSKVKTNIDGFCIDSRKLKKNFVFIAIDGKNHRGVDFVEEVFKKEASAVIVEKKYRKILSPWKNKLSLILVPEIKSALSGCSRYMLSLFNGKVIGITGSNGKTTTKNLIASILSSTFNVHQSEKNFNNEIGVPLTVFGLKKDTEILVSEVGINKSGEMDRLANLLRPDFSLITNISPTHLEGLKSEYNIMQEKSKLFERTGTLCFANLKNPWLKDLRLKARRLLTVHPSDPSADRYFDRIENLGLDGWKVVYKKISIKYPLYGMGNLENLIMAIALCEYIGVPLKRIPPVVSQFKNIPGRSQIFKNSKIVLLDESYNSNPFSMERSIEFIDSIKTDKIKCIVFGTMAELGKKEKFYHKFIGHKLALSSADVIFVFGKGSYPAFKVIKKMSKKDLFFFEDKDELEISLKQKINDFQKKGIITLVKGSRLCNLNEVVEKIKKEFSLR